MKIKLFVTLCCHLYLAVKVLSPYVTELFVEVPLRTCWVGWMDPFKRSRSGRRVHMRPYTCLSEVTGSCPQRGKPPYGRHQLRAKMVPRQAISRKSASAGVWSTRGGRAGQASQPACGWTPTAIGRNGEMLLQLLRKAPTGLETAVGVERRRDGRVTMVMGSYASSDWMWERGREGA